jgi:hypothetical protein
MGLRTRLAVVLAIAGVAAVAAVRIDQGAQAKPGALTWRCGVERWKVKTLQDQPELVYRGTKSIAWLVRRKKPQPLPPTRAPLEFNIYRVVAAVTHVIPQNAQDGDGDLHLVLDDGAGETMIAEAPRAACNRRATPGRRTEMKQARADVRLCEKAELIGVAFFDFDHGQTGLADNEIELHPILKFRCLG